MTKKQIIAELRDYGDLDGVTFIGDFVSPKTSKALLRWQTEKVHLYDLKFRDKRILCLLVAEALENEI